MVLTEDGFKKIKDVVAGDKVLTHNNTFKQVIESKMTGIKDVMSVKGMAFDEIRCTQNHKFYVRKIKRTWPYLSTGKRKRKRLFLSPEWVECKDLDKTYYMGIAINQNSIIPDWNGIDYEWKDGRKGRRKNELSKHLDSEDFWWLVGRYVGDGWHRKQGGIIICCAKDETAEITTVADRLSFNYSVVEEKTVNKIHFSDKELELFVNPIGRGAENKRIPGFVFDLPDNLLRSFVDGYVSADGAFTQGRFKTQSVSKELSYGIGQCVAKAYKTPFSIYKIKCKPKKEIDGRIVNQRDSYQVCWKTYKSKQDKAFYEDGYVWFPIKSVDYTDISEPVYDIEVDEDHSFTANGVIVHNCQDLSVAGKGRGMTKGSGTRSGLLWEVERLLNEVENLPQVLLMENVPQVHGKKNIDDFQDWIDFLESKGYTNFWQDLNAKNYGVAQNRNRTFMVSILGRAKFEFPKPIELKYVMKDYLEDEVEEKYYVNSPKALELIERLKAEGIDLKN